MIIPPVYTQQNDDFGEDPGIRNLLHSPNRENRCFSSELQTRIPEPSERQTYLSRHCLPMRPGMQRAMAAHRFVPNRPTSSLMRSSSCQVYIHTVSCFFGFCGWEVLVRGLLTLSLSLSLSLSFVSLCMIPQSSKIRTWVWTDRNRDEEGGVRRMHAREPQRSSIPWRDWDSALSAIDANTAHRCDCPDTPLHANFQSHHRSQHCQMLSKLLCKEGRTFARWGVLIASHSAHDHQNWKSNNIERERAQDFPPFPPTDLFPGPAFEALHCCT
jgi:hypothetical protein